MSSHDLQPTTEVLRILDANANRASEGLRVVEEYARFVLDDPFLTGQCKQLRHDLTAALANLPREAFNAARDTSEDVGTQISTAGENTRQNVQDVAAASQKRVEQSLRCIEEYTKTFAPGVAASVEQLRYQAYTLAKAIDTTRYSRERLAAARLYVLLDGQDSEAQFERLAAELIGAETDILQLRDKRLNDREFLSRARLLRRLTRGSKTLFVVNDRPDLAALSDADGVHVGQKELTVANVRTVVGPGKLVGVSTHSLEQTRQAVLDGAHYIGCGPTFPSRTKHFDDFPGLDFLRQVAGEITLPAFAIGGITLDNVEQVLAAGFVRVAVAAGIAKAADAKPRVQQFQATLARSSVQFVE